MQSIINIVENADTTGFTLLIPSVAVGNVGQLTIDLIISSYRFKKYATIWHPAIIPSVNGDPFDNDPTNISTACELFINTKLKMIAMQLRSGIEDKLAIPFFNVLNDTISELGCKQILILTSAFAHELHNVNASHFRIVSNDQELSNKLDESILPIDESNIFGGGDNRPDAVQVLQVILKLFVAETDCKIVYPNSWKYTFGNPPPLSIY
ncbi:hypothetical protein FQR65_LT16087 [Abscondita terminalis]|nr:hypothetical protein FQR65_LT16087 [Abscondita terminalis]